jgi:hypothetical protein
MPAASLAFNVVYKADFPPLSDLPNRVKTSFTSVGNSADSPQPNLRPVPAMGYEAKMLEV